MVGDEGVSGRVSFEGTVPDDYPLVGEAGAEPEPEVESQDDQEELTEETTE